MKLTLSYTQKTISTSPPSSPSSSPSLSSSSLSSRSESMTSSPGNSPAALGSGLGAPAFDDEEALELMFGLTSSSSSGYRSRQYSCARPGESRTYLAASYPQYVIYFTLDPHVVLPLGRTISHTARRRVLARQSKPVRLGLRVIRVRLRWTGRGRVDRRLRAGGML